MTEPSPQSVFNADFQMLSCFGFLINRDLQSCQYVICKIAIILTYNSTSNKFIATFFSDLYVLTL